MRTPLPLLAIFLLAAAYHGVNSVGQVSPSILTDELLFSKLAQSFASGEPFLVRGERIFFPAFLPALLQAPFWLIDSTGIAYAVAMTGNAVLMASAAFPAYWLARMLVRRSYALVAAAFAVVAPGMAYHAYLTSEALAYPVFLGAVAVLVRAIARPSGAMEIAALGTIGLAVVTRLQFVVLALAFAVAAPLAGRLSGGTIRDGLTRHRWSLAALGLAGAAAVAAGGSVLGPYAGVAHLNLSAGRVASAIARSFSVLPFAAGWAIVPGAVVGIGLLAFWRRSRVEAAFALIVCTIVPLTILETGVVSAFAGRTQERYEIYLIPLLAISYFVYAERQARTRAYLVTAAGLAVLAWTAPLPRPVDYRQAFESPTASAYGQAALEAGISAADLLFRALPVALIAVAVLARRRPFMPVAAAASALVAVGAAAYAADRAAAERMRTAFALSPPHRLDRAVIERVDLLVPPGTAPFGPWTTEVWNRSVRRPLYLGSTEPTVSLPAGAASLAADGTLLVDGRGREAGRLLVDSSSTAVVLDGQPVAWLGRGLVLYRIPRAVRIRSLAIGLSYDGWAGEYVRFVMFGPRRVGGSYRAVLELPTGFRARRIDVTVGAERRRLSLGPGCRATVELPARGQALTLRSDTADALDPGPGMRRVSVRVLELRYEPVGRTPGHHVRCARA